VCSSEPFGELLPNSATEERARIIAKELLVHHRTVVVFRFWLYVEVQTAYDELRFRRITGLTWRRRNSGWYEMLTPKEAQKIQPFIQSLRNQFQIKQEKQKAEWVKSMEDLRKFLSQSVETQSPSSTR
jgi:hypothetical protein